MTEVLVILAEGFEELEAITVIDLLRRAQFKVTVAGLTSGAITASRKTVVIPDMNLDQALKQSYDLVVLPGGQPGTNHLNADPRVHQVVQDMAKDKTVAAICAAPKILAEAGILENKQATAYPGTLDSYIAEGKISASPQAVVKDGNIITSRGPGTAIDFALTLIEVLADKPLREQVEKALVRA